MINKLIILLFISICMCNCFFNTKDHIFIYSKDIDNITENTKICLDDTIEIGKIYNFNIVNGKLVSKFKLYSKYKNKNYNFCLKNGFSNVYINAMEKGENMKDSIYINYCERNLIYYNDVYHINRDSLFLVIYKELKTKDIPPKLLDKEIDSLEKELQMNNMKNKDSLVTELLKKFILKVGYEINKNIK